jgi:aspartyl-tRNA(Asn)/glutamyl-tRNA(Gln) amidotransferase subunit C
MPLVIDQVRWIAHLARLEMSPSDCEVMAQQLSLLLEFVDQLSAVKTVGVEPLAHPFDVHSVFRTDEPSSSLLAQDALANAPEQRDEFFVVPAVFDARQP